LTVVAKAIIDVCMKRHENEVKRQEMKKTEKGRERNETDWFDNEHH
jgi:hypothetical protein